MQSRIILLFLFSIISLVSFGQQDQHHRTYETSLQDTIFNHMESTTFVGEVISIGFRQFDNDKQTLVLVTLDSKGNIKWQKEIDFGRDTTTLVGLAKIDLNSTQDSIMFTCLADINGARKEILGKCDIGGGSCIVRSIEGIEDSKDYPNVAAFIDSTEILLKSGDRPTIARIGLGDDLLWSRSYDFIDNQGDIVQTQITDIVGTIDSTIVLADDGSNSSFFMAELDSNGVQLWAENYTFIEFAMIDPYPRQVIKLNNMSTAVVGQYGQDNTDEKGFVMIVDTFGHPILTKQVLVDGNTTDMKNILQVEDGTLWMSGLFTENDSTQYFTTNMTVDGTVNWTTIYPGVLAGDETVTPTFSSLRAVDTGGAFLAGHSLNDVGRPLYNVMKHNAMGSIIINENDCSDTISVTLENIVVSTDTLVTEVENGGLFFNTIDVELKGTNILSPPTLQILDAYQFCPNEMIDTVLIAMVNDVTEITYQWGDENGILPEFDDSLRISDDGQYSVTVTIAEKVCYQMCDTIEVTRTSLHELTPQVTDLTQCSNGMINFENQLGVIVEEGQPPFEYLWSTNEVTDVINVIEEGTYSVTVTDQCGDPVSAVVQTISPDFNPIVTINQSALNCDDISYDLTAIYSGSAPNVGTTILWSTGSNEASISVTESGTYTVTIDDDCGLTATGSIEVVFAPLATEATISYETNCNNEIPSNSTVTFSVETDQEDDIIITLNRLDGTNPGAIFNPLEAQPIGNYMMEVTDGCGDILDTLSINLVGICDAAPFAFPKVFFPSNRNVLEEFTFGPIPTAPSATTASDTMNVLDRITDIEFKVFNRWGEEVYSVDSEDNSAFLMPWDGTHKGDPAPSEVYIWYFSYTLDKGTSTEKSEVAKGDITLVR